MRDGGGGGRAKGDGGGKLRLGRGAGVPKVGFSRFPPFRISPCNLAPPSPRYPSFVCPSLSGVVVCVALCGLRSRGVDVRLQKADKELPQCTRPPRIGSHLSSPPPPLSRSVQLLFLSLIRIHLFILPPDLAGKGLLPYNLFPVPLCLLTVCIQDHVMQISPLSLPPPFSTSPSLPLNSLRSLGKKRREESLFSPPLHISMMCLPKSTFMIVDGIWQLLVNESGVKVLFAKRLPTS